MVFFPFAEYWWFYLAFTGFVLALLTLDLGVFHRKAHAVSFREASIWSVVWIALALVFNYGFYRYALWNFSNDPALLAQGIDPAVASRQIGLEFLTGYVVEKALSLDNIFVFVMVFGYFGIPPAYQHRVLFFGILGALVFRAVFIALGSLLLKYHWVLLLFGAFLILTGIKMMFAPDRKIEPDKNPIIRLFRKLVPVTSDLHGQRFFIRLHGIQHATPLALVLLFVELSDIIFAIDSVPAIFAITNEPMIVFTSNVFAILGLRSLYFLLAGAVDRFGLLKYGLAAVLIFVGLKMVWLNEAFGGKFPIGWSLGIIGGIIAASIIASLLTTRKLAPHGAEAKPLEEIDERVLENQPRRK
jgi:tellurite resistance protein TerC